MPPTNTLQALAFPYDGWSSSWGGRFCIRPGGMGIAYELKTTGATGNAVAMNDGLIAHYQNGTLDSNLYNTRYYWPASDFATNFRFTNWNYAAQTVDLQVFYFFIIGIPPIAWVQFVTIPIPTPRLPFSIGIPPGPPLGYPATMPNAVTLRPLNNGYLRSL